MFDSSFVNLLQGAEVLFQIPAADKTPPGIGRRVPFGKLSLVDQRRSTIDNSPDRIWTTGRRAT